jgi:hypothetical protein
MCILLRIISPMLVLLLCACTPARMIDAPLAAVPLGATPSAADDARWWNINFRLRWEAQAQPAWHLDALLADQICAPALLAHRAQIALWRFHHRAVTDAAGHQSRLSVFTDLATANALHAQIHDNSLLRSLESNGQVVSISMNTLNQAAHARIAQTSDATWPAEIQANWPYFIMGVSQTWLSLINLVRAQIAKPRHADLTSMLNDYQEVNTRVNTLWREQGQHAYLHHLNDVFGYQPLIIRETNLKRF